MAKLLSDDEVFGAGAPAKLLSDEDVFTPRDNAKPTLTDFAKGVASGTNQMVSGIGYLAESAGATNVGKAIREIGDTGQKYWSDSMTPAGRRAAESQVFEDDPNSILPRLSERPGQALAMGVAQSAPSMLAAAVPGGIAATGLRAGAAQLAARGIGGALAPLAAGTAAPVGTWGANLAGHLAARAPSAIGFGGAEGAIAGATNAAQFKSQVEQMPDAELAKMPGYVDLAAQVGPSAARTQIAEHGARDILLRTTATTGGIGAVTGGGALGSAFQRVTTGAKGGIAGAVLRDAGKEAMQEIPQSAGERVIQNLANRDYLDPSQSVTQGVLADALSGGAVGAAMGGATGAGSHLVPKGPVQKALDAAAGVNTGTNTGTSSTDASVRDLVRAAATEEDASQSPSAKVVPPESAQPSTQGVMNGNQETGSSETTGPLLNPAGTSPESLNAPAAPKIASVTPAAPTAQTNQAESAGAPTSTTEGVSPSASQTQEAVSPAPGRKEEPTPVSPAATGRPEPVTLAVDSPDANLQNRDRSRAASVMQMTEIARNPDYLRLGPSRTPDSGAPMVFAVGDDHSRIPAVHFGNQDVAVMSDGQRVPFRYAVVDASQVEPSNFADGRVNPAFSTVANGTIKALNNGRTAGLRASYELGTAGAYQAELTNDVANVGLSPDVVRRVRNPILVRVYSEAENTNGMAAKSQAQGLGMSPGELAKQDAPLFDSSILSLFRPGEVASADNRDFVRAFVGKLQQSGQDVAGMMTDTGTLSPTGRSRIQAALMQAAYGDADLVAEMFDSIDTDIKAIGEALKAVAGEWANMRDSARIGSIAADVDITGNLVTAVRLIQKSRRERVALFDLVNQRDIETGEAVDELTTAALRLFYTGPYLTRAVGKDRLTGDLEKYISGAMQTSPDAGLFGDRVTALDVLQSIITRESNDTEATKGGRKPDSSGAPGGRTDQPRTGNQRPGSDKDGQEPVANPQGIAPSGGSQETVAPPTGVSQQDNPEPPGSSPDAGAAPAATLSYEEFSKQYRDAFANSMRYSPNEVGSTVFTERMAKLADDYPEFLARLEAEEEGKARPEMSLQGQTPDEIAAAEAQAKAQAEKEAKAAQAEAKARKEAEDRAEIKRRSKAAADSFELGGNAMANLSGQGDIFAAPPSEPTSNTGESQSRPAAPSDDLGALFDAELDAAFSNSQETGNEPRSIGNSQRDRQTPASQRRDEVAVPDERGGEGPTRGAGIPVSDEGGGSGRAGSVGVSGSGAVAGGEQSDQPVRGAKRPAGAEKLPAGNRQRQGGPGIRKGGVADAGGQGAAAVGGPSGGGVGPRSASDAGKSAAKNAGLALSDVAKGLNALFKPKPGRLGMGVSFDEDTYAAAKPYFQAGLAHFRQAGADIADMMRALIAALRDQFGMDRETISAMKPYVVRYMTDVKEGREAIEGTKPQEPVKDKLQQQLDAEPIKVVVGDKANIDATLPFLTEGQREDVQFAEKRWSSPDGYGVLFTNGTGTGKTFLSLGAIKRLTKQGKGNGIVVVPNEAVMNEWVKSAPALGLQITPLADTKDAGAGIAITTYANFGQNDDIAKRDYDFVAIDEAHLLMLGKEAASTEALEALRAISLHPDGVPRRAEMQNRELVDRIASNQRHIRGLQKSIANPDTMDQVVFATRKEIRALEKTLNADLETWRDVQGRVKADVLSRQGEKRPRVMFLSATPFAYEQNIQWGKGFLYEFPEVKSRGYNTPDPYGAFMIQHFGWRMRTGRLTQPDDAVDRDLMQRQFNSWLRKQGVLSARMLDVDHDYERKFILLEGGIGQKIDEGLKWLRDAENGRYWHLYDAINDRFDYLTRARLLEAIKARAAIPYIKKHHAMGRKVVVFYDFNTGGGINVFNVDRDLASAEASERRQEFDPEKDGLVVAVRGQPQAQWGTNAVLKKERVSIAQLLREFVAARPDLQNIDFSQYGSPLTTLTQAFPGAGVYNGMPQYKKSRLQAILDFNDDAKPQANLLLVQKAANAGWSGHDTTGTHMRVLINLGLPTAPIEAIQQEGRIYRVGQRSDANFHYFNTGTNWERYAFGSRIARRAGTAENLAMGEQARGLREAFIQAFENSDPGYQPSAADGKGGKTGDRDLVTAITDWDRAKALYFAQQKKTSRTRSAEGEDYFATPEPLGLKMVEWGGVLPGERVLEPSAGHGAIARWFPDKNDRTVIEPSLELASRLTLATDAKLINGPFENHDIVNKYDVIVMNPPFGVGGKTAIEHLDKAFRHLSDGGRVVALIPEGPTANKRFDDWMYGEKTVKAKPVGAGVGHFGEVFAGDTVTVVPIGWGIGSGRTMTGRVTDFRDGRLWVRQDGASHSTGYQLERVMDMRPTGDRTVKAKSAPNAYLRASIGLPTATFERAGTGVKTRVVIIDKIMDPARATDAHGSAVREIGAGSVKELFDALENMDVAGRALPAEKVGRNQQAQMREGARKVTSGETDETGMVQPEASDATVEEVQDPQGRTDTPKLFTDAPRVSHVTRAGKTIHGVIAKTLTKNQAKAIDPFTWSKDGGFFIRLGYVVRPPSVAEQERAVYAVNEPDGVTKDLFSGASGDLFPELGSALPENKRTGLERKGAHTSRNARSSSRSSARVLAVRQAPDEPGIYHVSTQLVTVGERALPVARINPVRARGVVDAAKAFAYLSRHAVEHYDAIVTDKDGRPLGVVGSFKGALTQTSVYPGTVVAELSRIDGAAHLWGAHNHPSGLAELSHADRSLSELFARVLDGSGVEYHGLFAMANKAGSPGVVAYHHTDYDHGEVARNLPAPHRVPIVERELTDDRGREAPISSPAMSRTVVPAIAGNNPGIVFLDAQNRPVAFVPFAGEELGRLKVDGRMMRLFRSVSQANAGGAIIAMPDGKVTKEQVANVNAALHNLDVRLLDGIEYSSADPAGTVRSLAEKEQIDRAPVVFSFAGQQSATADQHELSRAKQLLADGANANAVRQQTGWFKGVDGKWRFEIADEHATLKNLRMEDGHALRATSLDRVLDHPALFSAYPALRDMDVQITIGPDVEEKGSYHHGSPGTATTFGRSPEIRVSARTEKKALSTLLHEIQHGIQSIEAFAKGGSLEDMASIDHPQIRRLENEINALMVSKKPGKQIAKEVAAINSKIAELRREPPYAAYRRLAGEVEARNVQARQNFDAEQRKYSDPDSTSDTYDEDVIIVFNGKDAADAPAPHNASRSPVLAIANISPADSAIYDMVREGKTTAEILSFIGKSSRRPFNRYLASALARVGVSSAITLDPMGGWNFNRSKQGAKYAAAYSPETDTVALFTSRETERHILHELTHAATIKAIAAGGPAAMQMRALFRHVQTSGELDGQYGMSNIDEFVAEAFSNPKFQDALKGIAAPAGSKLKSAWQWFVRTVARILGLHPVRVSALDRAMTIGAELMRENEGLSGRGDAVRYNVDGDGGDLAPTTQPTGNAWQRAKAKAAEILSPKNLDKIIYELQDKHIDLRRLRDYIREIGGTITDLNDAYLGEELYHKRLAHRTQDFLKSDLRPLLADMKARGVSIQDFETFLHARHAPEANAEMAKRNPNQAEIDAGRAAASRTVRSLELRLQRAKARGLATVAVEGALNEARGELESWNGAQTFQGTEEERLSLSGMSDQAAAAVMSGLSPDRRADLDALAARVDAINEGTLQRLEDYGLMSKTSLNEWRKTYQHYIPLHRDEAHPDSGSHPIGQGFSTKGDAAKRRTGSNQQVTHILGHIAMQREAALTRGEKNHVMLKLYLMARQNPLPDVWKVGSVPMIDTIDKATGFVKSVPDPLYRNRPNVLTLRIAGKDVAIVMNEHNPQALRMAQALKNLDVDDLHYIIPIVGKATRYFASINTQYNPIFGVINLMRDAQEAALNLSTTELAGRQKEVLRDTLSILKEVIKNKGRMPTSGRWAPLFNEFNEVGGTTGYRDLYLNAEDRAKELLNEFDALDRGKAKQAWFAVMDWLSDYNEAMENSVRLAAYKAALDNGLSRERAASLAKNLTVNFNRKGRQTRELGALYAFFNAAVQGTTRMAQTLAGPAGRKIMAGGVLVGAVNAMIGIAAMGGGDGEDDEWEKIPEFVKERSIVIPTGKDSYISIPMPLGFQFLPNIGRLAVEMAYYKDKTAGKQMASLFTVLADAFNPLGGSSPPMQIIAPTVIDPLVALAQNKDWTGKPIFIENRNSLDPAPGLQRSKDSATPWAKGFAEAINAVTGGTEYTPGGWSPTPDQIDYVIGQLTGGLGREAGKVASTVAAPFTGEELPPYKIPLVGRLYGSTAGHSGQSAKFYENVTKANEAENEIKWRAKDGIGVSDYLRDHPGAMELAARGNVAERQVAALRKVRHEAVKQDGPDKVEKVREVNERMAAVMRGFNRDVGMIGSGVGQ